MPNTNNGQLGMIWAQAGANAANTALGLRFSQEGKSFDEMLNLVGSHIRKVFPEKFRNPNKQTASAVEGKGSTSKTARSPSIEDGMSKEEKRLVS